MIPTMLGRSKRPAVLLSGGRDSMIVLNQVRQHDPDIEVVVFRADFTPDQWAIIDNLIRLWDLTVVTLPPRASYLVPNGPHLARVDEYDLGGAILPHVRDFVYDETRCAVEAEQEFLPQSPLDYDCVFVGSRETDVSSATGQVLRKAVTKVRDLFVVAPIYYWTDEEVERAAKDLPYSREWYEQGDEKFDTGNIVACHNCLRVADGSQVYCPKKREHIPSAIWQPQKILTAFRERFGFEVK